MVNSLPSSLVKANISPVERGCLSSCGSISRAIGCIESPNTHHETALHSSLSSASHSFHSHSYFRRRLPRRTPAMEQPRNRPIHRLRQNRQPPHRPPHRKARTSLPPSRRADGITQPYLQSYPEWVSKVGEASVQISESPSWGMQAESVQNSQTTGLRASCGLL